MMQWCSMSHDHINVGWYVCDLIELLSNPDCFQSVWGKSCYLQPIFAYFSNILGCIILIFWYKVQTTPKKNIKKIF